MKVLFLINDAFGIGGTVKTTFNLGEALAERGHEVEVLSTERRRDVPHLTVPPAVRLMSLTEVRPDHPDHVADAPGRDRPGRHYPAADFKASTYNAWVEGRYRRYLAGTDADVVIATRPGLIAYLARLAPPHLVRIGQEHLVRGQHRAALRKEMPRHLRRIDAFVTVSRRDAEDYRANARLGHTRLLHIPNSIPAPRVAPSHGRAKLVVAAGRLVKSKRYDVLIRAFAKVVAERPDWQLRIYGDGDQKNALRALVLELGLHNHVRMMGGYMPIEPEWAKGAIAAVSADREPFGMTLVEAMRCGVPVVSTDAPHGPGEILTDGVDGLLTPVGDPGALGDALLRLINDEPLRQSMAAAALASSTRYDPAPIAERYEQLFEELAAGKKRRWWSRPAEPLTVLGPVASAGKPTLDWDGVSPLPPEVEWKKHSETDFQLVREDGTELQAGLRDTRWLLDNPAEQRIQLPYRRPDGTLGVRVTDRPVYAEVGPVQADADGVRLAGRLIGDAATDDVALVAVSSDSSGESREFPLEHEARTFRALIPRLPTGTWSLKLRLGTEVVPLAGLRDDIVDKSRAFVLPAATIDGVTLQPVYLADNTFAVRATA
ncbi:glycosyltransferase family 4 protein [Actinoplanes sp. NPDC051411]|uniref:glycosyltransferase family 4 protein n=1 Tax=Actinoplanes sp. NPDC051411 TaxID=3155522 RepID=UPI0034203916